MTTLPPVTLSEPAVLDLTCYRGDTGRFRVTITQDGAPLDVSAATWDCDIRQTADGALVGSMTVTPVAGQTNQIDVVMPSTLAETAPNLAPDLPDAPFVGVWDLEMTTGVDPDVSVTTILRGKVTLQRDVSRPPIAPPDTSGGAGGPPLATSAAPVGQHLPPLLPGFEPERVGGPEAPDAPDLTSVPPTAPEAAA